MQNPIDCLQLLTDQHTEVDTLFAAIEKGGRGKHAAFTALADKLAAHATIEEKIFYPAAMAKATEDKLRESVEEHLQIKRLIADLLAMSVDDAQFDSKIKVLKEEVSHHAHEEEEQKLFPQLRHSMRADERAALGNAMFVLFEELMAAQPRNNVPAETAQAASLPAA